MKMDRLADLCRSRSMQLKKNQTWKSEQGSLCYKEMNRCNNNVFDNEHHKAITICEK